MSVGLALRDVLPIAMLVAGVLFIVWAFRGTSEIRKGFYRFAKHGEIIHKLFVNSTEHIAGWSLCISSIVLMYMLINSQSGWHPIEAVFELIGGAHAVRG